MSIRIVDNIYCLLRTSEALTAVKYRLDPLHRCRLLHYCKPEIPTNGGLTPQHLASRWLRKALKAVK